MNPVSLSETVQAADNSRAQQSQHAQNPVATAESTTLRPTPAITKPVQAETRTEAAKVSTVNSSAQAPATNAASHSQRKVHYSANDDDDYVAKDTYVIYGSNGKPLRR
jgi:spore germination protein GerM